MYTIGSDERFRDADDTELFGLPQSIAEELFKEQTIISGYLLKKGELRRTWKKRWFVLRPGMVAYYKTEKARLSE
eukprot:jgi/Hompol1/1258/HPOL_000526-RA